MARRRGTGAKSSSSLNFPPPSGPWGSAQPPGPLGTPVLLRIIYVK